MRASISRISPDLYPLIHGHIPYHVNFTLCLPKCLTCRCLDEGSTFGREDYRTRQACKAKGKGAEPKANNAETVKPEAKAAKPKVNIAAVIALKKKTEVEKKAAEEKQRELARKQREAAARQKEKGVAKGGHV